MTVDSPPSLHLVQYEALLRAALAEDLGRGGDLTTNALVPAEHRARGRIVSRVDGVVAGIEPAATFQDCRRAPRGRRSPSGPGHDAPQSRRIDAVHPDR